MAIAGPGGVDAAIASGLDLDGTPIPAAMVELYQEVMELESQRARSGVKKSMRNRVVKTGSKHLDQASLDERLQAAGEKLAIGAQFGGKYFTHHVRYTLTTC